jgi:hypothetical protein
VPESRFVEASGLSFNTLFPGDYGFWEVINELIQLEPPEAGDPELLGLLASVGIVHGKPFEPDERMQDPRGRRRGRQPPPPAPSPLLRDPRRAAFSRTTHRTRSPSC